jgi:SAM-dependent methyltransferase
MTSTDPNAAQKTYWNEGAGPTWAAQQALLDWQMAPLSRAAIAALGPAAGERILDIGCGAGATSLDLAAAVGSTGAVLGVDLSAPLLEVARRRAADAGVTAAEFLEADAQTHAFAAASFDAAFSRFGVMFFANPIAAFANVRRALRRGGRLTFVCWRGMSENPILMLPMTAALKHFDAPPAPSDPEAPGPFAFAEEMRFWTTLSRAGFDAIHARPHDGAIGSRNLENALTLALSIGPLGGMLRAAPEKRDAVVRSVREALSPYVSDRGCLLPSATWIVSARNPG